MAAHTDPPVSNNQDGQRSTINIEHNAPAAGSSAPEPSPIAVVNASEGGVRREATTGSVIPFPAAVVTSDYDVKSAEIVAGDYSPVKPKKSRASRNKTTPIRNDRKPRIPGCEVVAHGAGWNVFRYWYDTKKPGEKWPKKHRAYECYLTQTDIREGKELENNGSKKTKRGIRKS